MRTLGLALVLLLSGTRAAAQAPDPNINSRYVVESVGLSPAQSLPLSRTLRNDLGKLVGAKLNQTLLDSLRERVKQETGARLVRQKLTRGEKPDTVRVTFEVRYGKRNVDVNIPKLAYLSREGWSAGAELEANFSGNTAAFGYINDGDELVERFAGIRGRFEQKDLIEGRVGLRFDAQSYREEWNEATLNAFGPDGLAGKGEVPGIYRTRTNFEPAVTVRLAGPLTWISGMSFQRMEIQYPAAHFQDANAVVQTLRLRQQWRGSGISQSLEADYNLRAAAKSLGSDYSYSRNSFDAAYRLTSGRHTVTLRGGGGIISGTAPLFERFVAGNLTVLRGWSKYDLTPVGASRLGYGTADYRYRIFNAFYDAGAAWSRDTPAQARQSVGFGVKTRTFFLALAFPLHSGNPTPLLMAGLNF